MRPARMMLAAAAGLTAALAGCSSGSTSSQPPSVAPSSSSAPSTSTGPGGIPVSATYREGQPFTWTGLENNVPQTWRITLDSVTCGTGAIFSRKVLATYYADEGRPAVSPVPEPGMKFCLVKFTVTNHGGSSQPWSASDATLNVDADAYQADDTGPGGDPAQAYMQDAQPHYQTADFGINPRVTAVSWAVYEIPAGKRPTSVSVPSGASVRDSAQVLVELGAS